MRIYPSSRTCQAKRQSSLVVLSTAQRRVAITSGDSRRPWYGELGSMKLGVIMEAVLVVAIICMAFTLYAMPSGISKVSADNFFLMDRSAETKQYNDTTVAYSLQVAVTIYFFYWGYKYGLSNIFFIGTWFLGLIAFGLFSRPLARFLTRPEFDGSLFSVVSRGSGKLRVLMGLLVVTSLVGLLFTELYLTAKFIDGVTTARLVVSPAPNFYFWVGYAFLATVVLWYCSLGGVRKVVITDTWQLSIAYLGIAVFIAVLAPRINSHSGTDAARIVSGGMALLFVLMAVLPGVTSKLVQWGKSSDRVSSSRTTFVALVLSAIICALSLVTLPYVPAPVGADFPKPVGTMLSDPFGWAPILGFTIINLMWQFSDYTAYHRLALVRLPDDEGARARKIRESIFVTALNSPLTWGLGIFAGMAIYATGLLPATSADVFNDFVARAASLANAGDQSMQVALIALAAFLACVMLSTVDSGFMSVSLIIVRDITKATLSPTSRFLVNLAIIIMMSIFAKALIDGYVSLWVFLNATYSWALVFGGIAIASILGKRVPIKWIYASLILGALTGAIGTFNPLHLPDLVSLVFPSTAAIVISAAVIFFSPNEPKPYSIESST